MLIDVLYRRFHSIANMTRSNKPEELYIIIKIVHEISNYYEYLYTFYIVQGFKCNHNNIYEVYMNLSNRYGYKATSKGIIHPISLKTHRNCDVIIYGIEIEESWWA